MKAPADKSSRAPQNRSNADRVAQQLNAQGPASESLETESLVFEDNRPDTLAQRKLQALANNSPRMAAQRKQQEMINNSPRMKQGKALQAMANKRVHANPFGTNLQNASESRDVVQLKGFKTLNGTKPNKEDSKTGPFVIASLKAWDKIFGDETVIDKAGGITATYVPSNKDLEAEATTQHEETIANNAFAKVEAKGGTAGTTITRFSKQAVPTKAVQLTKTVFQTNAPAIKTIIETALFGDATGRTGTVPDDGIDDYDMLKDDDDTITSWARKEAESGDRDWLVDFFLDLLGKRVENYKGKIEDDVLDVTDGCDTFSTTVFQKLGATLKLKPVTEERYVGKESTLTTVEVLAHEFGHVKAALNATPQSIAKAKKGLGPNFASVKKVIVELHNATNIAKQETPARDRINNLRFAWLQVVSEFALSEEKIRLNKKLENAIRMLSNVLISFEEYYNIEAVDNAIAPGSAKNKRISHGTEWMAEYKISGSTQSDKTDEDLANKVKAKDPAFMAKYVWLIKLKNLTHGFIAKYETYFPD